MNQSREEAGYSVARKTLIKALLALKPLPPSVECTGSTDSRRRKRERARRNGRALFPRPWDELRVGLLLLVLEELFDRLLRERDGDVLLDPLRPHAQRDLGARFHRRDRLHEGLG